LHRRNIYNLKFLLKDAGSSLAMTYYVVGAIVESVIARLDPDPDLVKSDQLSDKHVLRIQRCYRGNIKVSAIGSDFVASPDYTGLVNAAETFKGLIGPGALIRRGVGAFVTAWRRHSGLDLCPRP
jgi:hypothetical protein